ncbi:MAG: hypothetical protein RLZZ385_49 [Pseudomonadota bacterium]
MTTTIKILCVHGLGDHRASDWENIWQQAVTQAFPSRNGLELEFVFLTYDPIFAEVRISPWEAASAFWKLTRSGIGTALGRRGLISEVSDKIKWTAGYVVAWLEDEAFQQRTRELIVQALSDHRPDVLLAHSLGSLVTYNTLSDRTVQAQDGMADILERLSYVTFGSQLGNPFVLRNLTPGRLDALPVKYWYHLYNEEDDVFTAPIRLWNASNFSQVRTTFDIDGFADHAPEQYLGHRSTVENVWQTLAADVAGAGSPRSRMLPLRRAIKPRKPGRRALLIGINDYPNAADRLEGCVNDVFLMSSVLQECGFRAEEIRVCLNDRATAAGILQRLEWLLEDPQPGDTRFFYYSGHGATIPEYGEDYEPDRLMETLVPFDFDWTPEHAITDDQIYSLYAQLPYDTLFTMVFDCCHSGGIHRDGSRKPRGITPPDDIRHRELRWDLNEKMWVPRDFKPLNKEFAKQKKARVEFFGANEAKSRLGRASLLRGQTEAEYKRMHRALGPVGPYLPLILEACQEDEFSYEYRHGTVSYGAFTYALAQILRSSDQRGITFVELVKETRDKLRRLGYEQEPQIVAPGKLKTTPVPWMQ